MNKEEAKNTLIKIENRAKEINLTEDEWVGIASAIRHLTNAFSLDSNIDVASDEYVSECDLIEDDISLIKCNNLLKKAFKAGAEWMSEHNEKEFDKLCDKWPELQFHRELSDLEQAYQTTNKKRI